MPLKEEVEDIISVIFNIKNKVHYSRNSVHLFEDVIHKLDDLLKYEETDKPWCEYLPEEDVFLVEWKDKKYKFERPKGVTNEKETNLPTNT